MTRLSDEGTNCGTLRSCRNVS